ncbi:BEL1-like homeodomain protein 9 [Macadamia integrifolia]|uniref:BEL1-like homeodomain protein 9 n=1 Tax=Macadamia integrifolia TaxID=60698 RepID=UPI001C502631|nr:BEL1-like homeodomain protein 9 [Macadamia integrifolia]
MAEGFEPFHVPQQSRRDKLRVLSQSHPTCDDAAAALQGCVGLLPMYDHHSLLSSDMLNCGNPLGGAGTGAGTATVEISKPNPVCNVKAEGGNLMGYLGGFVNASSSSSSSHQPFLDPQSSLACNPFLYTAQNLRDLDHSFNGGEVVPFKPTPVSLTHAHDSVSTGQGLSLSLSSHHPGQHNLPLELNLQQYESAHAVFDGKCMGGYVASTSNDVSRSPVPLGPFTGYASVLKGSRFLKPAQQLMEELCDVGRGVLSDRSYGDSSLIDPSMENLGGVGVVDDSLACGDPTRSEHQRKKNTLLSMLDEVYKRYKMYYQQMHAVVASFESVAGLGNAAPYASFALKTMSKHFRCLKNAITDQLRLSKTLGEGSFEKDGVPRLGTADRGLNSQRPVHNLSILEHQHVWRPQRGLPERAVAVLRAWLFDHFLHPYPTDTDKQMLAKQTGLSRSQVSNWFINARVRLWKPMVEEIHMLETRQAQKASETEDQNSNKAVDHQPPSSNPLPSNKTLQTTATQNSQNPPTKRSRSELPIAPNQNDQLNNFQYHNLSSHHHQVGVSNAVGNSSGGVSLTLGLRQNNGIGLSEPFPMNIAHRFGLEANEGCVVGSFEAPNRHFGKDIGGQFLHDFVG